MKIQCTLATLALLCSCGTIGNLTGSAPVVDPTDPCGAKGYSSLLGSPLAVVTLPADLNDRVVGPGDAVTQDYVESRLNIELDAGGTIVGLSCG